MKQPWDPDPLTVEPEPVTPPPVERSGAILAWIGIAALVWVVVIAILVVVAPRGAPEHSPAPALLGTPLRETPTEAALPEWTADEVRSGVPHPPEPTTGVGSEGGTMPLTTPIPGASTWSGTATWYCSATSACPRGYGPSDMVAAIDRKDSPFRKGDRVVVRYHCGKGCDRHVTVKIVDVCACGGARLIDLTSGAFKRLAPLGQGVIPVTISAAGRYIAPPPTETKP